MRRLKELGTSVRAEVEKAALDPEREVASRALQILKFLDTRATLTAALLKEFPGLEYRLDGFEEHPWTEAFLEATEQTGIHRRHPTLDPRDIEPLAVRALKGARPEEWDRLIPRLTAWRLRSTAPALVPFLTLMDPRAPSVAWEAHVALRTLSVPEVVPAVLELARKPEHATWQFNLLETAACLDAKASVEEFFAQLYDRKFNQAGQAVSAPLDSLDVIEAIPPLVALIRDPRAGYQALAADALLKLDPALALQEIEKVLQTLDPRSPHPALAVLSTLRSPASIPLLLKLVTHPEPTVRAGVAANLGQAWGREAIPTLRTMLRDKAETVRMAALQALAGFNDRESVSAFLAHFRDAKDHGRGGYIRALGHLHVREIIPELRQLIKGNDRDSHLQGTAAWALGELQDRESIPDLARLLDRPFENPNRSIVMRSSALWALVNMKSPESLPIVRKCLKDEDLQIRGQAVEYLAFLQGKDALPEVLAILKDKENLSRGSAITALETIGGETGRQELFRLLREEEGDRELPWLVTVLGRVDAREVLPELRALLTHPVGAIRYSAAEVLCRHGIRDGVGQLVEGWNAPLPTFTLNALRTPDLWTRLLSATPAGTVEGTARDVLRTVLREAGFSLVESPDLKSPEPAFPSRIFTFEGVSTPEILRQILSYQHWLVMEKDGVRLLSEKEAKLFWRRWWGEECLKSPDPLERAEGARLLVDVKKREDRRAEILKAAKERETTGKAPGENPADVGHGLTPALRVIPGLVERLAAGDDSTWTEVFLETANPGKRKLYRSLKNEDLDLIWPRALRGAQTPPQKELILRELGRRHLVSSRAAVIKLLEDRTAVIRSAALGTLAGVGTKEDAPLIATFLDAPEALVVNAALGALSLLDARAHIPTILEIARGGPAATRMAALEVLADWKVPEVLPILVGLSKNQDYTVRRNAAFALARFGGPRVSSAMRDLLKDADPTVVDVGLSYFQWNGMTEAVPDILPLLDRQGTLGGMVVEYAITALGTLGARDAVPKVLPLLQHEYWNVAVRAATFLADMRAIQAIPDLRKILQKGEVHPVWAAGPALVEFGDRESVPEFYRLLKAKDASVRSSAAEALVVLEGRAALPAIREAMKDMGEQNYELAGSLLRLAPEEALPIYLARSNWGDGVEGLLKLRRPEVRPIIAKWLDNENASLRAHALASLVQLEGRNSIPLLREALDDADLRDAAALLLAKAGEREAVPLVVQSAKNLFILNSFRAPAVWERLSRMTVDELIFGNSREILEFVARRTGLKLEGPPADTPDYGRWTGYHKRFGSRLNPIPLLEAVEQLPWYVILEPDRLRVIGNQEAAAFWKVWWESEKAGK
ncbi:MAG TPA: HEAT repeat domain-containing protein [Planctomycetota bacterium]|nr:HEAT repeat domain-containing protein [Planctomycetota bacterium]